MLGYATKGDWTIGQSREIEEDLVVATKPYRLDEDCAKPLTAIEERLVSKHVEGIVVPRVHKHLTNAYFGDPAVWIWLTGH